MPFGSKRACDRCHAQKLRCPRSDLDSEESCSRCLNAGAHCVYSAPLPTGRPSNNLAANKKAAHTYSRSTTSAPAFMDSGYLVNSATSTSPNLESLLQTALHTDTSMPWDPQLLDFSNIFGPSLVDDTPQWDTLDGGSIPSLDASSDASSESWPKLYCTTWSSRANADDTKACIRQLSRP